MTYRSASFSVFRSLKISKLLLLFTFLAFHCVACEDDIFSIQVSEVGYAPRYVANVQKGYQDGYSRVSYMIKPEEYNDEFAITSLSNAVYQLSKYPKKDFDYSISHENFVAIRIYCYTEEFANEKFVEQNPIGSIYAYKDIKKVKTFEDARHLVEQTVISKNPLKEIDGEIIWTIITRHKSGKENGRRAIP